MIEKVGYTRPITTARPVRKAGSVSGTGFADALAAAEGVLASEGVEATIGITAMGSLLGAQEVDEREARRQRAIKQGRFTLETLERLRDALLLGSLPLNILSQLERQIAAQREDTTDPVLQQILAEIETRAAVELAKLEMSGMLPPPTR